MKVSKKRWDAYMQIVRRAADLADFPRDRTAKKALIRAVEDAREAFPLRKRKAASN